MRKGWRNTIFGLVLWLLHEGGGQAWGARANQPPAAGEPPVRLTVDIAWNTAVPNAAANTETAPGPDIQLEVTPGEVIEAIPWPFGPAPELLPTGAWKLGNDRSGRVRARIAAPLASSLLIRVGNGPPMRFPLPMILEGPRRTPPQSGVEVTVERLGWDAVTVELGDGPSRSGIVLPGAKVPVTVGFNILSPDSSEAVVHCVAELKPIRGGPPVWTSDFRENVATNAAAPALLSLPLQMPSIEGTYVLDFKVDWEPLPQHDGGTGLGRLIRRGRRNFLGNLVGGLGGGVVGGDGGGSATRRTTIAVLGPPDPSRPNDPIQSPARLEHDQEVDAIDLARFRNKQRLTASGRSKPSAADPGQWLIPEEALAESTTRDRLRGWITRGDSELAKLAPADANGFAWSALSLKVNHPGRPHKLTLAISAGHPSSLGVAMIGPSGGSSRPRLLLDACAAGPPVLPDGSPVSFTWLVWPDTTDPVLVLVNRAVAAPVQIGALTLTELAEIPVGPAIEEPSEGMKTRDLGLQLTGPHVLERFGVTLESGLSDPLTASKSLSQYLAYCGASTVVLSESLADRERRQKLDGQAAEDAIGPDPLTVALGILGRSDIAVWLDLGFRGPLPGLPAPNTAEAAARGLVRVDRRGLPEGVEYHPLNKEVRDAMSRRVAEAVANYAKTGNGAKFAGVLIRLGRGPTLLGAPDTGLDDPTFRGFLADAFDPETVKRLPGLDAEGGERFESRSRFIAGSGRMPWLAYRSKRIAELYQELAKAASEASPGVRLAVSTPGLVPGSAGSEARKADLNDLAPSLAWRAVGLDLDAWPNDETAPIVLRGMSLSTDDLAHDLATHPELDAKVISRSNRGVIIDIDEVEPTPKPNFANPSRSVSNAKTGNRLRGSLLLSALPLEDGPTTEEPLGHALAALDSRWIVIAAPAVSGHEDRFRSFAKVFRSLPVTPGGVDRQPMPFGISVRTHRTKTLTYLALANDTPYPVRLDTLLNTSKTATVYDLGRSSTLKPAVEPGDQGGGRHLVLDLLPFGVSAVRVGDADLKVGTVTPYPPDAVLTAMQARYDEISGQLSRLSRGVEAGRNAPLNPGFEPEPGSAETKPTVDKGADHSNGMEAKVPALRVKAAETKSEPPVSTSPLTLAGWSVTGGQGNALAIDPDQPKGGKGSLRIDAKTPPASAVSDEFTPDIHTSILVRAWFRADRADAKVRVWIEGRAAGKSFRRVSELTVGPDWTERAVKASDVPSGGLESTRIRFEVLSEGRLWIDELAVSGESLSEPERRNARNALLAALQAYKEKRYADFARLSSSHWARLPGLNSAPSRLVKGESAATGASPSTNGGVNRVGDASPLPEGRRLR